VLGLHPVTDGVAVPPALVSGFGAVLSEFVQPVGAPAGGGGALVQLSVRLPALPPSVKSGQLGMVTLKVACANAAAENRLRLAAVKTAAATRQNDRFMNDSQAERSSDGPLAFRVPRQLSKK